MLDFLPIIRGPAAAAVWRGMTEKQWVFTSLESVQIALYHCSIATATISLNVRSNSAALVAPALAEPELRNHST